MSLQSQSLPLPLALELVHTLNFISLTCSICKSITDDTCSDCHYPICQECLERGCESCQLEKIQFFNTPDALPLGEWQEHSARGDEEEDDDPLVPQILIEQPYPFDYLCVYYPSESEWKQMEMEAETRIHFTITDVPGEVYPNIYYLVGRQTLAGKTTDYMLLWEESDYYQGWRRFISVYYHNSPQPHDCWLLAIPPPGDLSLRRCNALSL